MLDIKEKRHIQIVGKGGGGQASSVEWDDILNKPDFATVATSGDYDDLTDKPNLATVATSGSYNDLSDKPSMSTDIPEDKNNAIIIYNESGNTTFTQGVWGAGPIPTEIWQNGVKVTGSITSPYPLVNGKSVIMETLNGEPNTSMEDFEFADKNATIWVYADYKRYNHPISGTYTGDINVVLNNNEAGNNLTQNSIGVKYWLLDNKGSQIRFANNNTIILSDKSLQLYFQGTVTSASDFNLTIYVPKTQYDNLVALLQATFPDIPDITWITDHINQYDYIVSDGYKLRMVTEPAAQVNSDWNANSGVAQILNKPTIPTVPNMAIETLTFTLQGGTTKTIEFYTVPDYFYVEDISGSDNTLSIKKNSNNAPTIEVFKSTDKVNWISMGTTSTTAITATIPANSKLYLKATIDSWSYFGQTNRISTLKNSNVGGNIMSLLYGDNFENQTTFPNNSSYNFANLFQNYSKLVNASNLELPVTTMTDYCYSYMFGGCTALTTAPALPATTLAQYCYQYMFSGCSSLTTAPALSATTLAWACYRYMFSGCSNLTTTPATLPATTLTNYCYEQMFSGCSSLTTAPELPATTLVDYCYNFMFNSCSHLNKVTTYANNISARNCIEYWLNGVAATGDFYNLGSATYPTGSASGIPTGWTEHTSL